MRVKTEERRQAIIEKAREVFQEEGFDRASMSEIAARVGGSKATLYSYFKSKEELFVAVMKGSTEVGNVYKPFADPSLPKVSSFEDLRRDLGGLWAALRQASNLGKRAGCQTQSNCPGRPFRYG